MLLFGCKKEDPQPNEPNGKIVFYQTKNNGKSWGLWFQFQYLGKLKYAAMSPHCGEDGYITVDMPPGKYQMDFQSFDNEVWGDPHEIQIESGKCKFVGLTETSSFPTTTINTY